MSELTELKEKVQKAFLDWERDVYPKSTGSNPERQKELIFFFLKSHSPSMYLKTFVIIWADAVRNSNYHFSPLVTIT